MDGDLNMKRQVNLAQLKGLLDFLQVNQELAKGLTRGRRGKLHTLKLWSLCAKKLNVFNGGAVKDGKAWSKYWCDWKYRVRRRALELKAARDANHPPPDGVTPLSSMEDTILSIIGEGAVDNIVIKTDPLGEDSEGGIPDNNEENLSLSQCYVLPPECKTRRTGRKRRHSSREFSNDDEPSPGDHKLEGSALKNAGSGNDVTIKRDDDDAAEFLRLEREKLEHSRSLRDTVHTLTSEVTRLADIMGHIRDALVNNRIHI